jgi:hypothetical protein
MSESGSRPSSASKRGRDACHEAIQVLQAQIDAQMDEVKEAERLTDSALSQLKTIDGYLQRFDSPHVVDSLLKQRSTADGMYEVRVEKFRKAQAHLLSLENELRCLQERLYWVNSSDEVIPSIDDHKMSFVNRSETVKELLTEVHWTNYVRSTRAGGLEPKIPFLDNLFGMGKSTFAENYISECNKIINSVPGSLEFKASISHARTLIVQINPGELYNCQEKETLFAERVVADTFISAIEEHIPNRIQGTTSSLKGISGSYLLKGVVSRFIHETNEPLFLVFDEIGLAFQRPNSRISSEDDENLRSQKGSFLFFCQVILHSLLIRDLHILLVGNAAFMESITNRRLVNPESDGSARILHRLSCP